MNKLNKCLRRGGSWLRATAALMLLVPAGSLAAEAPGDVSMGDFAHLAVDGDWSPAIQAAIDQVSAGNGYELGATVFFPPGRYRVDRTIKLGLESAHYGVRLSGYGAALVGSRALDGQPGDYETRKAAFEAAAEDDSDPRAQRRVRTHLRALEGELDLAGNHIGQAILELWNPPGREGSAFVIEGLAFEREEALSGVAVKVPAETVPKNITFRDIRVRGQNVGVHVNYCWQVRFESCVFEGNRVGLWGRNHFNSVSVTNSTFEGNELAGLAIGPNAGQWGSSGINVSGNVFSGNGGYGLLNAGGVAVHARGNRFEDNGCALGVLSPFWNTTAESNAFSGFNRPGRLYVGGGTHQVPAWRGIPVPERAHVLIDSSGVVLRNNSYQDGPAIFISRLGTAGAAGTNSANMIDQLPEAGWGVPDRLRVPGACGLGYYEYDEAGRDFSFWRFRHVRP